MVTSPVYCDREGEGSIRGWPTSPPSPVQSLALIQNHVLTNNMLQSEKERWKIMVEEISMHSFIFRVNTHSLSYTSCFAGEKTVEETSVTQ